MNMNNFMAVQEPGQMTLTDVYVQNALAEERQATMTDRATEERLDAIAWQINLWEGQAKDVFRNTALKIGEYLTEAQALCPRGRWGEWLRTKVDYSERKAQQLMQVYEGYRDKKMTGDYEALSFTQIYQLLSAPEESRDALARRAAEEDLSTRQLKEEINRLKAEAEDRQQRMEIETADAYREGAIQGSEGAKQEIEALRVRAEKAENAAKEATERANSVEASVSAIRDTAAKANDRATELEESLMAMRRMHAEAENELKKVRAELRTERGRTPDVVEVMPESAQKEIDEMTQRIRNFETENGDMIQRIRRLEAENDALKARNAADRSEPVARPDALEEAMNGAKAGITRAVAAIKTAQEAEPAKAKRARDELMVICTAIVKKLGGVVTNEKE